MGWLRRIVGEPGPKMVRVAVAPNGPQMELILSLLHDAQIPATMQRTGFYRGDEFAAGPRDILVPEHFELDARSVIEPILDEAASNPPEDAK